ncbi:hypothetical protein MRX96_013705 [Rhipicephalus microplus]
MPTADVWSTDTSLSSAFDDVSEGAFAVLPPSCGGCLHPGVPWKGKWKAARVLGSGYDDVTVLVSQLGDMRVCAGVSKPGPPGALYAVVTILVGGSAAEPEKPPAG